jgi:hypothetical protein
MVLEELELAGVPAFPATVHYNAMDIVDNIRRLLKVNHQSLVPVLVCCIWVKL